jgi:DNA helicase-2/ATP-dependent DNA helicase PcrA
MSTARPELPAPVGEEERLLAVVLGAARRARPPRATEDYDAELVRLRDSLAEERLAEDQASLLEEMDRVAVLRAQRGRTELAAIDTDSPYFGHLRLEDDRGRRDVLIGKRTCIGEGLRIVDWRNAPISRVYYQCREGDDYELRIAGREAQGRVLLRRTVTIQRGALQRVATADAVYVREGEGWKEIGAAAPALRGGAGAAARPDRARPIIGVAPGNGRRIREDKHLPEIASLLDPEQFALITRPDAGVVAIQGSAGSGKTTVALHRVAYLAFQDPARFRPTRALVVVLSPALASYISQVLPALGVEGVTVQTYEAWAAAVRHRHFPELPRLYAEHTPAAVSRLKRHAALLPMLGEEARRRPRADPADLLDELLTDRRWLGEGFARHAPGAFREGELDEVHDWCRRQYFARVEGVGPSEDDLPCLDPEDDTLLLYLHQILRGPLRYKGERALRYSQLVVDEVQDLSPTELKVLLGTLGPGAPVTLAGDVAQQVSESDFGDFGRALSAVGLSGLAVSTLRVSYRSTASIVELGRAILGPLAPEEPAIAPRPGAPVELFRFGGRGEMYGFLAEALQDLEAQEPTASVALLAARAHHADLAFEALDRADLPRLRRVRSHDFSFAPGVEVSEIRQAKGLEFDYVVLLDVDATTYPVTDAARRLLHVGVTRAAHQCWLTCVGTPTLVLPNGILSKSQQY